VDLPVTRPDQWNAALEVLADRAVGLKLGLPCPPDLRELDPEGDGPLPDLTPVTGLPHLERLALRINVYGRTLLDEDTVPKTGVSLKRLP
jgi:hypothetical protein